MDTVAQLCEQLSSADQVKAYQARRALAVKALAAGAPGKEAERKALSAELAAALTARTESKDDKKKETPPRYAPVARNEICRVLADVGGDAEVPALVQALADFDVREMARFALDRIPTLPAEAALAEAAQKSVGVEFRVGLTGALAKRLGSVAVEALKQAATSDPSSEVRLAAAEALAAQPDTAADAVILQVSKDLGPANPRATKRMNIARLQLAGTLAKAGQKDAARGIYQAMVSDGVDESQKKAARSALEQLG